jgi:hypothetical protein
MGTVPIFVILLVFSGSHMGLLPPTSSLPSGFLLVAAIPSHNVRGSLSSFIPVLRYQCLDLPQTFAPSNLMTWFLRVLVPWRFQRRMSTVPTQQHADTASMDDETVWLS